MAKITYANKVTLNPQPSIADENKVTDADMNEIKSVVNGLIVNSKSTDDEKAYSCDYVNGLNTYSTTEQRIGTWIDGKPLYRKVINFGTLPSSSSKSVAHGISNLDFITQTYGMTESVQDTYFKTIPSASHSTISAQINIAINNTNVFISTGQDSSLYTKTYIVLEYTKTTD